MLEKKRRGFTSEYKTDAVKLCEERGGSLQSVAEELGVHANQLRSWRIEQETGCPPDVGVDPLADHVINRPDRFAWQRETSKRRLAKTGRHLDG